MIQNTQRKNQLLTLIITLSVATVAIALVGAGVGAAQESDPIAEETVDLDEDTESVYAEVWWDDANATDDDTTTDSVSFNASIYLEADYLEDHIDGTSPGDPVETSATVTYASGSETTFEQVRLEDTFSTEVDENLRQNLTNATLTVEGDETLVNETEVGTLDRAAGGSGGGAFGSPGFGVAIAAIAVVAAAAAAAVRRR